MKKKILNIGSVTKDTIITPRDKYNQIGGAVYYQLSTLHTLKIDNDSIILIGKDDVEMIDSIDNENNIHKIITDKSMEYTNIYNDDDKRIQKAYFPEYSIKTSNIKKLNIKVNDYSHIIISPLSPYEINVKLLEYLKKENNEIVLLIQGFIRNTDEDNNVIYRRWDNYTKYLKYADIISSDDHEFQTAFNIQINKDNMKKFIEENSLKMVIITKAADGSSIYTKDGVIQIPVVKTSKPKDPTGLGDTYISSFIAKKDETTLFNAGLYASVCAKNKLEETGPLKKIKNRIDEEYNEVLNQCRQNNKWNDNG